MVRIPTDRTCHMQCDFREEGQKRRDLIGNNFCRMIMSVIHQRQAFLFVHCRIAQCKFCRTNCVCLNSDSEYLRFYTRFYHLRIIWLRKDLIDGFFVTNSWSHTVCRHIFESVSCPDIHHTWDSCLLCKILGNTDTCFSMLNPEFPCLFVRA